MRGVSNVAVFSVFVTGNNKTIDHGTASAKKLSVTVINERGQCSPNISVAVRRHRWRFGSITQKTYHRRPSSFLQVWRRLGGGED